MTQALEKSEEIFFSLLDRSLKNGRVRFLLSHRQVTVGSDDSPKDPAFVVRIQDPLFFRRVLTQGNLGFAESYMEGGWQMEEGELEEMLTYFAKSRIDQQVQLDLKTLVTMGILRVRQIIAGTRENSQAHYDIGEDLYDSFLDVTRGYTCGYQKSPTDTIEKLQENKYERICQKLRLQKGEKLYDIGCGYGGLLIHAAQHYGVHASGITNSNAHGEFAQRRIQELGLSERVRVEIGDFRQARGIHDKVVSVGVLEHQVPHEQRAFFDTVKRLMSPEGFGLIHTIGCVTARNTHDPFIQKYIFPGSTQNPLSLIASHLERQGLAILDVENMARHYAPTSQCWLDRFRQRKSTLSKAKYDEAFVRMWEYYLALCVAGASATEGAVFQVLFTKEYRRALPMHRVC